MLSAIPSRESSIQGLTPAKASRRPVQFCGRRWANAVLGLMTIRVIEKPYKKRTVKGLTNDQDAFFVPGATSLIQSSASIIARVLNSEVVKVDQCTTFVLFQLTSKYG